MTERSRIFLLIGIMSAIAVGGVTITIYILYEAAFQEAQDRLRETVQSRARIIEAVGRFDHGARSGAVDHGSDSIAFDATLAQLRNAHARFEGFGQTGEFTLARREGDKIVFLLSHRHHDREAPNPVDLSSKFAEPMRRALRGEEGALVGLDYRGEMVLAAYEPVAIYDLGIVAKIDLAEVQWPFIRAAFFSLVFVFIFIGLGTVLFLRIGNPIIARLEHEVKEHANARKDLVVSEARFRRIFESGMMGVLFWDAEGKVSDANDTFLEMLGYSRSDLLEGINWRAMTPKDYFALDEEALREIAAKGHISPIEKEYFRKDGSRIPIIVGAATLEDARDRGVAFILDRTEFKAVEEAKRATETSLRLMVSEVRDYAIFMLDQEGRVASWNVGAQSISGYKADEIIGQHFSLFYPPEDIESGKPARELDIASRAGRYEEEGVRIRKDGSTFVANVVVTSLKDDSGALLGFSKVTRDITERKRVEEQIRRSLREKEVLLREIHHRVKNNLQIVSSLVNLQSKSISDADAVTALKESRDRINTMAMIYEKLYGTKDLRRIDFADYVETFSRNLVQASDIAASRIALKIGISGIELDVQTAIPTGMIINELLSNSLKHAFPDDREGTIHISLAHRGNDYLLDYSDDGIGLPEGLQPEATESLGMRLVHMFVEQLDGSIKHIRGEGTRFMITFSAREG